MNSAEQNRVQIEWRRNKEITNWTVKRFPMNNSESINGQWTKWHKNKQDILLPHWSFCVTAAASISTDWLHRGAYYILMAIDWVSPRIVLRYEQIVIVVSQTLIELARPVMDRGVVDGSGKIDE